MAPRPDGSGAKKGPDALRTISEVSAELGVAQHVLRFWETRFPDLKPLKRSGNRRYYRRHDIEFAAALHKLLHQHGYTVKGVQKLIAEHGARKLPEIASLDAVARAQTEDDAPDINSATTAAEASNTQVAAADAHLLAELKRLRAQLARALVS